MGRNGPVRVLVENGVRLKRNKAIDVQLSPREKQEADFKNGRVWELAPGVTPSQIEAALSSLKIRVRQ